MRAESTFAVIVGSPGILPEPRKSKTAYPAINGKIEINLSSGKMLTPADFDIRRTVDQESSTLLEKCAINSPDAMGDLQDGSIVALCHLKGNRPDGSAVLFYPYREQEVALGTRSKGANPKAHLQIPPQPKQYVVYRIGKWHGLLATWSAEGKKEFWCNYSNGQRHGWCCLFNQDAPKAVLEFAHNKINAVHLISGNQPTRTLADADQIAADPGAAPILREIDEIEQRLKADDHEFCDRVKLAVNQRIGQRNNEMRQEAAARASARAAQQDAGMKTILKKAGW